MCRGPEEPHNIPIPGSAQGRLEVALKNLLCWELSLPMAKGWDKMRFKVL